MYDVYNFTNVADIVSHIDRKMISQGWVSASNTMSIQSAKRNETINGNVYTKNGYSFGIYSDNVISPPKANYKNSCEFVLISIENGFNMETGKTLEGRKVNGFKWDTLKMREIFNESYVMRSCAGALIPKDGTMYMNYSEMDGVISLLISFKFSDTQNEEDYFQHIAYGKLKNTIGNKGHYISGSRSDWGMMPQKIELPFIDGSSNPLFGTARIPSTICECINIDDYRNIEKKELIPLYAGAGTRIFEMAHTNGRASKQWTHYGTGRSLCTSIIDPYYENDAPKIPHYNFLLSHNGGDIGRTLFSTTGFSNVLQIDVFLQRDPYELENYSYLGTVPRVGCVSLRNMGDATIHDLDVYINSLVTGKKCQVFPHCLRNGKNGYNGIAVEIDYNNY